MPAAPPSHGRPGPPHTILLYGLQGATTRLSQRGGVPSGYSSTRLLGWQQVGRQEDALDRPLRHGLVSGEGGLGSRRIGGAVGAEQRRALREGPVRERLHKHVVRQLAEPGGHAGGGWLHR